MVKKGKQAAGAGLMRERVRNVLAQARGLVQQGQHAQARGVLGTFDERHPGQREVLVALMDVALALDDSEGLQYATGELLALGEVTPDTLRGHAGAALQNLRPATALAALQRLLALAPDPATADRVRRDVAGLEQASHGYLREIRLEGAEGLELARAHERVQNLIAMEHPARARQEAEALLARRPDFRAALNNISLAHWLEGDLEAAITTARRTLELQPDNVHALSNLTRFLVGAGRTAEAREVAARMRASGESRIERWVKEAEALSALGDDAGVLDTLARAQAAGQAEQLSNSGALHHLAAVAAARTGDEARARELWQRALQLTPGLPAARENLDALSRPADDRPAPWPYPISFWLPPRVMRRVGDRLQKADASELLRSAASLLANEPMLAHALPAMLDRGDPTTVRIAMLFGTAAREAGLRDAVRAFAQGKRGLAQDRAEASRMLAEVEGGKAP